MQVSETIALRGVDGELEDSDSGVGRGRDEFDIFAEEGGTPSLGRVSCEVCSNTKE